jgi:hypothetical protein
VKSAFPVPIREIWRITTKSGKFPFDFGLIWLRHKILIIATRSTFSASTAIGGSAVAGFNANYFPHCPMIFYDIPVTT